MESFHERLSVACELFVACERSSVFRARVLPCAMMPTLLLVMVSRPPTRDGCVLLSLPLESARVGGCRFWRVCVSGS